MSLDKNTDFITWLDDMLKAKNWSDNQLAKNAKLSHSVISKARSGILPKWEACEAIARAFNVSPIVVFQKAGLLSNSSGDPWVEDMNHKIGQLAGSRREMAERIVNTLLSEQDRLEQSHTISPKTKPAKP